MTNPLYFNDEVQNVAYRINLDSQHIKHKNSQIQHFTKK